MSSLAPGSMAGVPPLRPFGPGTLAGASAALALVRHRAAARRVVSEGLWDRLPDRPNDEEAAFWYVMFGLGLISAGVATHRMEAAGAAPRRVAAAVAVLGVGGGAVLVGDGLYFGAVLAGSIGPDQPGRSAYRA